MLGAFANCQTLNQTLSSKLLVLTLTTFLLTLVVRLFAVSNVAPSHHDQQTPSNPVDDKLHGKGGEQHTQNAGENFSKTLTHQFHQRT